MVIVWISIVVAVLGIVTALFGLIWRPNEDTEIACALFVLGWFTLSYLGWKWSIHKRRRSPSN